MIDMVVRCSRGRHVKITQGRDKRFSSFQNFFSMQFYRQLYVGALSFAFLLCHHTPSPP